MRSYKSILLLTLLSALCMLTACGELFDDNDRIPHYYAVQVDNGSDWSIIDANGDIVADEEYDNEDHVSVILGETYWVKSGDTYQLYSLDNPRQPVNDREYTAVTQIYKDRCLATRENKPIEILDAKGEVVATLPKDVVAAQRAASNTFCITNADDTYGLIDRNGVIIINDFREIFWGNGTIAAVARKTNESKWQIYDNAGKKVGELPSSHKIVALHEGYISVVNDKGKAMILNHEGKMVFQVKQASYLLPCEMQDDKYYMVIDKKGKYGLVDNEGNEMIRSKYDEFRVAGKKLLYAKKNSKWGMISFDDEKLIPFKYQDLWAIGDNYLVKVDGGDWRIVDREGERVGKASFSNLSNYICNYTVYYSDISH